MTGLIFVEDNTFETTHTSIDQSLQISSIADASMIAGDIIFYRIYLRRVRVVLLGGCHGVVSSCFGWCFPYFLLHSYNQRS